MIQENKLEKIDFVLKNKKNILKMKEEL